MHAMAPMEQRAVRVNGIRLNLWEGGHGRPVLLLHGYPQTAQMWRKVAPALLGGFTVVCPDLRGYGDSDKPRDGYDKRTMARDVHELMLALGHPTYAVVGHDRGARVGHRLALDHAGAVTRLCVLDVVPTHTVFARADRHLAAAYWHWFFFQAPDLPEAMLAAAPEPFLRHMFRALTFRAGAIEEAMVQEYLRAFTLPGTIRASLEDYRAAATRDLEDDEGTSSGAGLPGAGHLGRAGPDAHALRRPRHLAGESGRYGPGSRAPVRPLHPGRGARRAAGLPPTLSSRVTRGGRQRAEPAGTSASRPAPRTRAVGKGATNQPVSLARPLGPSHMRRPETLLTSLADQRPSQRNFAVAAFATARIVAFAQAGVAGGLAST